MALTEQDRAWHETYEQLDPEAKRAVDAAFSSAATVLRLNRLTVAKDDRAEQLVAALTRFVVLSNPDNPDLLSAARRSNKIGGVVSAWPTPKPAVETGQERHARHLLKEVAVKHKDLFGAAETKQTIFRYGRARALREVPSEHVAALHRVLQGAIDRARELHVGSNRVVGMRPEIAAPYGRSVDTPHGRQPVLVHESTPTGRDPDPYLFSDAFRAAYFSPPPAPVTPADEDRTPAKYEPRFSGGGGGFDGGGASGSWDASPSSSDPSPSNND